MAETYIARGERDLRFSPDWEGESLVFDSRTSDLFVIPSLGRLILEDLLASGATDASALARSFVDGEEGVSGAELEARIDELLVQLADCRLVERLCVDCCGSEAL